jgi:chromosome segregation ATPase
VAEGADAAEPDPAEVRATAAYGAAPAGLLECVPYTLHVLQRRRALRAARAEAQRKQASATRSAHQALVELGRALYEQSDSLDLGALATRLDEVRRAWHAARERGEQRSKAETEAAQRRRELDESIEEAQAEANPWRDRETKLRTQLQTREHSLKRAEAQLQRAEIELRNARAAETPDGDRLQMLQADRDTRQNEVELARTKVRELTDELGQVRRELSSRLGRVTALQEERRQAESTLTQATKVHASTAAQAERELDEALAALGEDALGRGLADAAGEATERARQQCRQRDARAREVRLYERAADAWDRRAFGRGAAVLGAAAALVIAMLITAVAV